MYLKMRKAIKLKMLFKKNDIKMLRNVLRMRPPKRWVLSFLLKESKEFDVLIFKVHQGTMAT